MKVLNVINSLDTGGAEKLIVETVPIFRLKGVEMDVLCLSNVHTAFWNGLESKTDAKVFGLTKGSVYNPLLIFKLIPYLKKYNIISIHLFPSLYWVVLAKILSFSSVKLVFTEHSTNNRRRENSFFKILDRFIYKRLDKIITIAVEVDKNLKEHLNLHDNKFQIINNGVDINLYSNSEPYSRDMFFNIDDTLLIQVSSFSQAKDQNTLIRSLLYLPKEVNLLLVGDGYLRAKSEELVIKNNLQDRVKFLGNRYDVPRLLKTSDIVVLSSHYEGLSLSNIEGMSAKKPFIGSNVPGIREIVKGHGILFERGNEKDLAKQIIHLLEDVDYYNEISCKSLKRAQEFDINKMVDSYIELYELLYNK